eukprot:1284764-Rhodomonas_salina.2
MKEQDQHVYGYWDNEAITQMHADAYGDVLFYSPITDILNMPLPGYDEDEPATADLDINDSFDAFNDAEITDKAISTGILDNDVHPAIARAHGQQE